VIVAERKILWIEDHVDKTSALAAELQKHWKFITAWQDVPQHSLSSGIRYLLEAMLDASGDYPMPDLLLLDSDLVENPASDHDPAIRRLCQDREPLRADVERCLQEKTGAAVLRLIGRHICPSSAYGPGALRPRPAVVYLSVYGETDICDVQGGRGVLMEFPGLLSGYFKKREGKEWHRELVMMLYEVLNDPRRGLSLDEIRTELPPEDADFLLGPVGPDGVGYPWSDTYRLALNDLVTAGQDIAWPFVDADGVVKGFVEFSNQQYDHVLKSHRRLPRALILGDRGTGKERFARALHNMWYRKVKRAPFVSVNIGGFPGWSAGDALQVRLFGSEHADGSFAPGCVPSAWNGTVFMDEVGYANKDVQDALLRLMQEGEYEPALRARRVFAAHCCFIGATNPEGSSRGTFRHDVADRFAMRIIRVPSLISAKEDLLHWVDRLLKKLREDLSEAFSVPDKFEFPLVAANILQGYNWPGNLRELSHALRRMQIRAVGRSTIPLAYAASEVSRLNAEQRLCATEKEAHRG
jgi:hypothetical protein